MEAFAPAALALTVTFDIGTTLGLALLCFHGPATRALLPRTGLPRLDVASTLLDVFLLLGARCAVVLLPLFGLTLPITDAGTGVTAVLHLCMTAWLLGKAILGIELAHGHKLVVGDTGVVINVVMLVAAETLGILLSWFEFGLLVTNKGALLQPTAQLRQEVESGNVQQRLAVQDWLDKNVIPQSLPSSQELTAPLLASRETNGPQVLEGAEQRSASSPKATIQGSFTLDMPSKATANGRLEQNSNTVGTKTETYFSVTSFPSLASGQRSPYSCRSAHS